MATSHLPPPNGPTEFRGTERSAARELESRIDAMGLACGREQSFKLGPGRLLRDRVLLGVQRAALELPALLALVRSLGMPPDAEPLLVANIDRANAVFLASEDDGPQRMFKVYLEFWDELRRRVRSGDTAPQLLHLGVKWSSSRPGHHEQAHYTCHPLLGTRDVLRRMREAVRGDGRATAVDVAQAIVRRGAMRQPRASLLYLDASESGNARRSFDVNLYKTGLCVGDVAAPLTEAAAQFGLAAGELEPVLQEMAMLPLGHVAAGSDRRGAEFLSIYAEVAPLPEPPGGMWSER